MKQCIVVVLLFLCSFTYAQDGAVPATIYDFKIAALKGGTIDLSQYRGKKILIVNTPEERDYALQYSELEALYKKYKDKLVIIGIIADDFEIQPGSRKSPNREKVYNVTFPLAAKMFVRGSQAAPLYKWLSEKKYNKFQDTEVSWDFIKFLINEQGAIISVSDPSTKPAELAAAIER